MSPHQKFTAAPSAAQPSVPSEHTPMLVTLVSPALQCETIVPFLWYNPAHNLPARHFVRPGLYPGRG